MMNGRASRFGLVLVTAATLLALIVALFASSGEVSHAVTLAAALSGFIASSASYVVVKILRTNAADMRNSELTLLKTTTDVEESARNLLQSKQQDHGSVTPTVRSLISALLEDGTWTVDDATNFRQMLRVRNTIVHGREEQISAHDVKVAVEIGRTLREKIAVTKTGTKGARDLGLEG
jgi:hypothetical protein